MKLFEAHFTLDGINAGVNAVDGEVAILVADGTESAALSPTNAELLAYAILAAVHEAKEASRA